MSGSWSDAPIPGWIRFVSVNPISIATKVFMR